MIRLLAQSPQGVPRGHTLFLLRKKRLALVSLFGVGKVSLAVSLLCTASRLQLLWERREQGIIQCCIQAMLSPYQPVSAGASLPTTPSANHCINSKEQKGKGDKVVCLLPLSDSNTVRISETTPPSWKKNQSPFLLSVGTQNKPRDRSQPSLLEKKPRVFSIYTPSFALTSTEIQLLKQEGKPLFYVCQIIQHSKLFRISKDDNTLLVFTNLVITEWLLHASHWPVCIHLLLLSLQHAWLSAHD